MDAFALVQGITLVGLAALIARSVWTDVSDLRIPNTVCAGVVLLWVVYASAKLAAGQDPQALPTILWALAVLAGGFVIYCLKWMGAGDVKLIAALALWAGPALLPDFLLITALAGGVVSLGYIVFRWALRKLSIFPFVAGSIPQSWLVVVNAQSGAPVPYALPIAFGAGLILWTLGHGLIAQDVSQAWLVGPN